MTPALATAVERTLSVRMARQSRVSGGDINDAYRVDLADGRRIFIKANLRSPRGMFEAEAHGLDWLRAARAISVPAVIGTGVSSTEPATSFLALEWLEQGHPCPDFDDRLGQRLAALHRFGAEGFGLDRDNFIGRLEQCNRKYARLRDFFVEQRLMAPFELARRSGHFEPSDVRRFEQLITNIDRWLGPEELPSRLHGDLWSGNLLIGPDGDPWLIDPAVYAGHREIDLAMMRLFGGFSERCFDAYNEAFALAPGHRERIHLWQLYPLLVHVNLFGGGYVGSVRRIIDEYR